LLIDLHTHSYPASDDSFMAVDELIETAKERGLDGVCLTEHDAFWDVAQVQALGKKHRFLVLPGAEINTDGGHLLVFGLQRYVFGMHKPEVLQQLVEQQGGVIIAAHPYRRRFLLERPQDWNAMLRKAWADPFFKICHALETVNGRGSAQENRFAGELGAALALHATGASDAHRVQQLGSAATRFEKRVDTLEDLITELRAGRFQPVFSANGQ